MQSESGVPGTLLPVMASCMSSLGEWSTVCCRVTGHLGGAFCCVTRLLLCMLMLACSEQRREGTAYGAVLSMYSPRAMLHCTVVGVTPSTNHDMHVASAPACLPGEEERSRFRQIQKTNGWR